MSIEGAVIRKSQVGGELGKAYLNFKYPDEFELYTIALEVIDSTTNLTVRYFIFPVMPSNMDESTTFLHNIKKTLGGVVALSSPNFNPVDISLSGNFGRKFKVLLGEDYIDFVNSWKGDSNLKSQRVFNEVGIKNGLKELFDEKIKTGYGCCKVLEEIIKMSNEVNSEGKPYLLILHNPSIGNSYVIKPVSLKFTQSQERNMIWDYSLQLKAVAPLNHLAIVEKEAKEVRKRLNLTNITQKGVNSILNKIMQL